MKKLTFAVTLLICIGSCTDDSKNKYDSVYDQLDSLYNSSKYSEAVVLLDGVIINDSTEYLLYFNRGISLQKQRSIEISLDSSYRSDDAYNKNFGTRIVADYNKAISLLEYQIYELENDSLFTDYIDVLFLNANVSGGLLNNRKYEIDTYSFLIEDTNISESDPELFGTCLHMRGFAKSIVNSSNDDLSDKDWCAAAKDIYDDMLLGDTFLTESEKKAPGYVVAEFCNNP